ncbi:hypothetical protein D3C87_1871790 [compost metagenome]
MQQHVEVTVTEIDEKRNRIGLSMKTSEVSSSPKPKREQKTFNQKDRKEKEPETDMASKLAALASKFK